MGTHHNGNNGYNKGKVYQYDLDGNFIREWKHCTEAYKTLKCSSHLYFHLENGFPKTIAGSVFTYTFYMKYPKELLEKTNKNYPTKIVQQFDLNGLFIKEYNSLMEAAKFTEINQTNISYAASGKRKTAGGFIWKYKE